MKHFFTIVAIILISVSQSIAQRSVSIIVPESLQNSIIVASALDDVRPLLIQASGAKVSVNDATADILIKLPSIDKATAEQLNHFAAKATFPYHNYPEHDYTWVIRVDGKHIVYDLRTTSYQGVSFGLYGLLQEHLGFRFYHPKQSIIPQWSDGWPVENSMTFSGRALFDKKGFHIHSQHPLELTEQLLDPNAPHSIEDVRQYMDWLVRNGQTYFEFCLLNDVDQKLWPAHAKAFVDYAHNRGLLAGADISLHMIQQKSYQLYKGSLNKKKQIEKNLKWLLQADWDYLNMEFSTAEFISGNQKKKEELRLYIIDWLKQHSHTTLTGRHHIVAPKSKPGKTQKIGESDSTSIALDRERGVSAHTVMFYNMTEENAPVYENKNQRHQFEFLLEQMKQRETWYYPESAYWVTFDISIPLYLLPYLSARLADIDTCAKYGVPGHLTFSSGWEWGYWLFDWSIARWSWQYSYDGKDEKRTPTMYAFQMSNAPNAQALTQAMQVQQQYLKDSTLMQWMTAMTITDEIGIKALSQEYEPRPQWSYKCLERKADQALIDKVRQSILPELKAFADKTQDLANRMNISNDSIAQEWKDGIEITALRARHRFYTLQYILDRRDATLHKVHFDSDTSLMMATAIRALAQKIVDRRQEHYRYPLSSIASKRWDHTAYHFGYLWLASNLHLWHREEEEARKNKYSPFFMNVWNVGRIAGLIK